MFAMPSSVVGVSAAGLSAVAIVAGIVFMHQRRARERLPKLSFLSTRLAVVRLSGGASLEAAGFSPDSNVHKNAAFFSTTRTSDETSIVVDEEMAPPASDTVERGWVCFKLEGPLDFSLIGILSRIASALASHEISIFAISTYDTDYVLLKHDKKYAAINVLKKAGYVFE